VPGSVVATQLLTVTAYDRNSVSMSLPLATVSRTLLNAVGGWMEQLDSNQDELLSLENTTLTRVRDILYVSVGGAKSYVSGPLLCICQCCIVDRVRSDDCLQRRRHRSMPTVRMSDIPF